MHLMQWVMALAAMLPQGATVEPAKPIAATDAGQVVGLSRDGVDRFLGIPFAAPPVGAWRWKAPQPVQAWRGVRKAQAISPICIQDSANNPLTEGFTPQQSEDCLYLNVYRPAGTTSRPLPVMLWIHGGAFIMGAGSMPDYDGSVLARHGAVVITINYRLGRFGTFAHPTLTAEQPHGEIANYGLMDQIAALRWARANAAHFGGDEHNITIMGESAGASSVNFLMTSPAAAGLFDKAISQSGGSSAGLKTLAEAEREGAAWAAAKDAHDLAALRALPASAVLDAPVRAPAFPVIDGRLIVGSTTTAFASAAVAKVPYLVGANDHEESLMRWLPGAGDSLIRSLGDHAASALALYRRTGESRDVTVARMWGENAMTLPARQRAEWQAQRGQPVWLYRFGYVPSALRRQSAGVGHADEIQMVFGVPATAAAKGWSKADTAMADQVAGYWVAFARTGNPNHGAAPRWPRFSSAEKSLMLFGNYDVGAVRDFAGARLDALQAAAAAPR